MWFPRCTIHCDQGFNKVIYEVVLEQDAQRTQVNDPDHLLECFFCDKLLANLLLKHENPFNEVKSELLQTIMQKPDCLNRINQPPLWSSHNIN